jgi:hypothetical protein
MPLLIANSILFDENRISRGVIGHEIIHVYQYENLSILNTYFNKVNENIHLKYSNLKPVTNHLYFDTNYLLFRGLYILESKNNECYFDNIFEYEANYYSIKRNCD